MESAGTTMRPREDGDDTSSLGGGGGSVSGTERPSKRQRGLGSGGRGAGYSPPEVSFFLSLLEEHLPVTNKEWKAVVRLHNAQFPSLRRTPNSLRRKFSSLCRCATNGADELSLPAEVRRAIHAKRRMKNRGDVPEDDDDLPDSDDEDGEQDDDSHNGSQQRRRESTGDGAAMPSVPPTAPHGATAHPIQAAAPRYYSNGQQAVASASTTSLATPAQSQGQINNTSTGSRAQAMLDRLSDVAGDRRDNVTQADLIELIKLQLLQSIEEDRRRRHEETERREEERRHREEERAAREEFRRRYEEERARREQDLRRWEQEREETRRRHEEFMQVILSLLNKK